MLSHIALPIPFNGLIPLFTSIGLLVIGTGLLKPNISSAVGDLYSKEDFRRDSGFNVFYTGMNVGRLLAPKVGGTLGQRYYLHIGVGVAAIGMFIGLVTFLLTKKNFLSSVGSNAPNPLKPAEKKKTITVVSISSIIIILVCTLLISMNMLTINIFT